MFHQRPILPLSFVLRYQIKFEPAKGNEKCTVRLFTDREELASQVANALDPENETLTTFVWINGSKWMQWTGYGFENCHPKNIGCQLNVYILPNYLFNDLCVPNEYMHYPNGKPIKLVTLSTDIVDPFAVVSRHVPTSPGAVCNKVVSLTGVEFYAPIFIHQLGHDVFLKHLVCGLDNVGTTVTFFDMSQKNVKSKTPNILLISSVLVLVVTVMFFISKCSSFVSYTFQEEIETDFEILKEALFSYLSQQSKSESTITRVGAKSFLTGIKVWSGRSSGLIW